MTVIWEILVRTSPGTNPHRLETKTDWWKLPRMNRPLWCKPWHLKSKVCRHAKELGCSFPFFRTTRPAGSFLTGMPAALKAWLMQSFNAWCLQNSAGSLLILLAKAREYVLPALVCVSVCLSVCLSATTITKTIVDGFVPNFTGRFLGGKGRLSSCFVTIGRGMWK